MLGGGPDRSCHAAGAVRVGRMTASHPTAFGAALDAMARSVDRLLETVDALDDAAVREPSLLPGWTRAHVLTHVARNADGLVNLVHWARTGEETPMYAGGRERRDADIEAGSARQIGDLRLDVADSAERLLGAFVDFPPEGLDRELRLGSGMPLPGRDLPMIRTREVEIHHVDLASAYTQADWPPGFVTETLDRLAPLFRDGRDTPVGRLEATDTGGRWQVAEDGPALSGPSHELLAWLTGRARGERLTLDSGGAVPPAPPWS